jgi:hypothetical protein
MNDLLKLMHDTMGHVAAIKGSVTLLKKGNLSDEDNKRLLDIIDIRANELNGVLDSYYIKQKQIIIKEFILCSAIHYDNGAKPTIGNINSGVIVCGRRHCDCNDILRGILGDEIKLPERESQGFITSLNRFVSRAEAFKIAKANNQIIHKMFDNDNEGTLTSEDLFGVDL